MAEELAEAIVLASEKMQRKEKERSYGTLYAVEDRNKDGVSCFTKFVFSCPPRYTKEFHSIEQALTWAARQGFERVSENSERGMLGLVVSVDLQYSVTRSKKIVALYQKCSQFEVLQTKREIGVVGS